ncbi:Clr5 domain-containing protein, partial [Tricladium varicosporioides]
MDHNWECHKVEIQQHYLSEDKTLAEVMEFMKNEYGFSPSKNQYERQFRKWKFSKYQKKKNWKEAGRLIQKRKREGKESKLYVDGVLVPKKKICKELSRHGFTTIQERYGKAPSPKTPETFYICTPPATLTNNYQLDRLPFSQFQAIMESRGSPFPDLAATAANLVDSSTSDTVLSNPDDISSSMLPSNVSGAIVSVLSSKIIGANFTEATTVRNIHSRLRAILPEEPNMQPLSSAKETHGVIKLNENAQYLSLAIYLISNNILDSQELSTIIEHFQKLNDGRFLKPLISINIPTISAFMEKLFVAAVISGDIKIVKAALKANVDPNTWDNRHGPSTPLQYAIERDNIELVHVLLA